MNDFYQINDEFLEPVTEEQLHKALCIYDKYNDKNAEHTIVMYILNESFKSGNDIITEEQINNRLTELVTDFCLEKLSKKGLVDVIFDDDNQIKYKLNGAGKKYIKDNLLD